MVDGVSRYVERVSDWDPVYLADAVPIGDLRRLLAMSQGVLSVNPMDHARDVLSALGIPVVVMGTHEPDFPSVTFDEVAVGRMAVEHFASLGLAHVASCGYEGAYFADRRQQGVEEGARSAGLSHHPYAGFIYPTMDSDPHEVAKFHAFLRGLPKPCGMFCVTAIMAHLVLHQCRVAGVRVPDDLAILGVDDDEQTCGISRPPLSTVDQDAERAGYEAAALLDRLMRGGPPPRGPLIVPPAGVLARQSTDLLQIDSPEIGRALRYIRQHATRGLRVQEVLAHVAISRRALERGLRRNIGRTAREEIVRVQVEHAKRLLRRTRLPLPEISARCGFTYPSKLSGVFKRETGSTPSEYRREAAGFGDAAGTQITRSVNEG